MARPRKSLAPEVREEILRCIPGVLDKTLG